MEQKKESSLEQFYTNIEEHRSIITEVENHQILDLNNQEINLKFNNLINRLSEIDKGDIIKEIPRLFIILNRLKLYQFTSFLNLIDIKSPDLLVYFVMEAMQLRSRESNFFLHKLIKLKDLKKLNMICSISKIKLISNLLQEEELTNDGLEVINIKSLIYLLQESLINIEEDVKIFIDTYEHELVTPEQRRIAYLKGIMSKLKESATRN